MRKNILCLLVLAGWVAACGTNNKPAAARGPDDPYKVTPMTADQVAELKARLDKLQVGMARAKVLEIIDLDSFHIHAFENAGSSGVTYHIASGHTLEFGLERGDYDSTLKWARFDGEVWPKNYEENARPVAPAQ